jgi:hypothetical protein
MMPNQMMKLPKSAYSLDIIRAAILSFPKGACQISDIGEEWLIDLSVMPIPLLKDELLRRLEEFSLRASLEKRFSKERDAILALAFGQQ